MNPISWFVGVVLLSASLTAVPAIAGDGVKQPTVKFTQTRQRYYYGTVWTGLNQDEMDQFTQDPMKFIKENKRKVRSLTPQQWATDVKELTHEQQVQFFQSLYKNESKEAFDPDTRAEARKVLIERFKSAADEAQQMVGQRQSAAPAQPTRTSNSTSNNTVSPSPNGGKAKSGVTSAGIGSAKTGASGSVTPDELQNFNDDPVTNMDVLRRLNKEERAQAVKDLPRLERIKLLVKLGTMNRPMTLTRAELERFDDFRSLKTEIDNELKTEPKYSRNLEDARQQIDAINSTTNGANNRQRTPSTETAKPSSAAGKTNVKPSAILPIVPIETKRTNSVSTNSGTRDRSTSVLQVPARRVLNKAAFRENPLMEIDQLSQLDEKGRSDLLSELSWEKKLALLSQLAGSHPMKSYLKEKYPDVVAAIATSEAAKARAEARAAKAQGGATTQAGIGKENPRTAQKTAVSDFDPYLVESGFDQLLKEFPNLGSGDCISAQYLVDLKDYIQRLKTARDVSLGNENQKFERNQAMTRRDVQKLIQPYTSALKAGKKVDQKVFGEIQDKDDRLFAEGLFKITEKENALQEAYDKQSVLQKKGGVEFLKAQKDYFGKRASVMEAYMQLHQYDKFAQANAIHQTSKFRDLTMGPDDQIFPSGEPRRCIQQWKGVFAGIQKNIDKRIGEPGLGDMQTVLNGLNPNSGSETRAVSNTTTVTTNSKLYGSGGVSTFSSTAKGKQLDSGSAGANGKAATAK